DAPLGGALARRQLLPRLPRHGAVGTGLAIAFADDHREKERIRLGSPATLDHVDLLGHSRPSMAGDCSVGAAMPKGAIGPRTSPPISLPRHHIPCIQSGCVSMLKPINPRIMSTITALMIHMTRISDF